MWVLSKSFVLLTFCGMLFPAGFLLEDSDAGSAIPSRIEQRIMYEGSEVPSGTKIRRYNSVGLCAGEGSAC